MLTEKDYCDYNTCVALKELGYNGTVGECSHFGAFYINGKEIFYDRLYNSELKEKECLRVPLYLAQKWLREEYNLHLEITYSPSCWTGKIYDLKEWDYIKGFTFFKSFEDALHTLINEAVKILKEE